MLLMCPRWDAIQAETKDVMFPISGPLELSTVDILEPSLRLGNSNKHIIIIESCYSELIVQSSQERPPQGTARQYLLAIV